MRFWNDLFSGTRNPFSLHLSLQDAGSIGGAPAGGGTPPPSAAPNAPAPVTTSAPAPSAEPVPVPAAAPDSDPSAGYEYTSLGDLARQLAEGPPLPPPGEPDPTLTATPAKGAPPVPAEGEPAAVPGEVPPAAPAAQVEPFQALKAEVETYKAAVATKEQELAAAQSRVAEFETFAPAVEVLRTNPGMMELVNILAPVVSAGLNGFADPRAVDVGSALIKNIHEHDQRLSSALINGTLAYYGQEITDKALAQVGISKEDIPDYQRWKASGGAATPAYTLNQFPEWDAEGMALVPITDPATGVVTYEQLDSSDAKDVRTYNYEKQNFERSRTDRERAEADRAAEAARKTAEADAQRETTIQGQKKRVGEWAQGRSEAETAAYTEMNPAFTGEFEEFSTAASSMAHTLMWNDPTYQRLLADGKVAAANGEGRATAIALELDRVAKAHIAKAVTFYSNIVARLTAAEAATQDGKPKLPADAPKIGAETQLTSAPQPTAAPRPGQPPAERPERLPGEDYVTYTRRVNAGSLGQRMVAQVR